MSSAVIEIFTKNETFAKDVLKAKYNNEGCRWRVTTAEREYLITTDRTKYFWWKDIEKEPTEAYEIEDNTGAIVDLGSYNIDFIKEKILPRCSKVKKENFKVYDTEKEIYDVDILIDRLQKIKLLSGNKIIGYEDSEYGWQPINLFSLFLVDQTKGDKE